MSFEEKSRRVFPLARSLRRTPETPRQFDLLAGRFRLYFEGLSSVGTWRSLVAHLLWEQRVAGSNPAVPTSYFNMIAISGLTLIFRLGHFWDT
jgi:hypothetical protein